jgi:hypothetical protein
MSQPQLTLKEYNISDRGEAPALYSKITLEMENNVTRNIG